MGVKKKEWQFFTLQFLVSGRFFRGLKSGFKLFSRNTFSSPCPPTEGGLWKRG